MVDDDIDDNNNEEDDGVGCNNGASIDGDGGGDNTNLPVADIVVASCEQALNTCFFCFVLFCFALLFVIVLSLFSERDRLGE